MGGLAIGGSVFTDYDVTPDGRRFVMFSGAAGSELAWVSLIGGWFEELKSRAGASGE